MDARLSPLSPPAGRRIRRSGRPAGALRWLLLLLYISSCNVTRYLDSSKGERLLVKNSITLKTSEKVSSTEKALLKTELLSFIRQKPNRRLFYTIRFPLWLHYKYRGKSSRFARWVNKKVAEPPTLYNLNEMQRTARNFENQMRQRGFLHAGCTFTTDTVGAYKSKVHYTVQLGRRYRMDSIFFTSRDTQVLDLLQFTRKQSHLKSGAPLDGRMFDAEKLRITSEMKNRGYAYFVPNFVEFTGDSTATQTNVTVEVLTPGDSLMHKVYTIGKVTVFSGLIPDLTAMKKDTTIGGVYFTSSDAKFDIKAEHLYKAIAIRPGWPYRQVDFDQTARKLNELGVFRFVSIKPYQDNQSPDKLNVEITLAANDRFSPGWDFDANTSNSSNAITGRLFGLSTYLTFTNRNIFSGAENLQTNLQYNIEFDAAGLSDRFIFAQEFKFQNDLVFPRFFDYMHLWRRLNTAKAGRKPIVSDHFYQRLRTDAKTQLSLNYNYLQLFGFYRYHSLNAALGLDLRGGKHQYAFDHIGIDVLIPRKDSLFNEVFGRNEFLKKSFGNQLFTGLLFRSFNYNFAKPVNRFGETTNIRFNVEVSGLEEWALNRLWNLGFNTGPWTLGKNESELSFSNFARLDADAVYTRIFNDKGVTGALRFGIGAATAFGDTKGVPYVKQFFVGGPSSLRAWRIREIGPGGYYNAADIGVRPFYQAGDFRLELNGEMRFPLFGWFKGAAFVDAGNIWSLDPDDTRDNSQLDWDFYKNIAIGTGLGLRADFGYFVLRLDFGLKLRWPFLTENRTSYWVPKLISHMQWKDWSPNLAVGYPF